MTEKKRGRRGTAAHPMEAVLAQSDLVFDLETVERAIDQLAVRVTLTLADRNPVVMSVMTGGLIFTGDLVQRLRFPLELDYLHATRYHARTSGTELEWLAPPTLAVAGRSVLVVDDVLDHGHTLAAVVAALAGQGADDVRTAVLVDKQLGSAKPIVADFVGLEAPNRYLFGRGMDYHGYWRNLPEIYAVPDSLLTE